MTFAVNPPQGDAPGRIPVFVVTDHSIASRWLLALFSDQTFHVTLATSYAEAKQRLIEQQPTLIIAAVQLGEYNGLGLVLRAKAADPGVRAVVLSRVPDPVLQADAESVGATFVTMPIEHRELRAAIIRTLFQPAATSPAPIRPPFERRQPEIAAAPPASMNGPFVERHKREALFPFPLPAVVHFGSASADA